MMTRAVNERMMKSYHDLFVFFFFFFKQKTAYEIMRELKDKTGAHIGAGTLYPLLYELEERRLVAGEWMSPTRRSRRVYRITDQGERYRDQSYQGLDRLLRTSFSNSNH